MLVPLIEPTSLATSLLTDETEREPVDEVTLKVVHQCLLAELFDPFRDPMNERLFNE